MCDRSAEHDNDTGAVASSLPQRIPSGRSDRKSTTEKVRDVPEADVAEPPRRPSRRKLSRHERHKCHKSRHRTADSLQTSSQNLVDKIHELKRENRLLTRWLNASVTSLDSGLSGNEVLSPFEVDVSSAYQHVKSENARMSSEIDALRGHCRELEHRTRGLQRENRDLESDVVLLKNLVYRLNVELERYQEAAGKPPPPPGKREILPKNYHKNFLKPVLPLLRAYSEAVQEKAEMIETMEAEMKRFGQALNELVRENERLYAELERKVNTFEGDAASEVKSLRRDLDMAKQENSLLVSQIELEQEKLAEVHSAYRAKVAEILKENEAVTASLQEQKADLCTIRGKYSVLKQEFERLRLESESRVPMAVHSASIGECKRLFQDLRSEYEAQKQSHLVTIAEQEEALTRMRRQAEETPREPAGGDDLSHIKRQLRESNSKVDELSGKLSNTRRQLHKAMAFAEDIVREQESLLVQLHAKQKENSLMVTHFGSLKKQLKSVERGAQEGLDTVEERMKCLESDNARLSAEVKSLRMLVADKEDEIARLIGRDESES